MEMKDYNSKLQKIHNDDVIAQSELLRQLRAREITGQEFDARLGMCRIAFKQAMSDVAQELTNLLNQTEETPKDLIPKEKLNNETKA